MQKGKTVKRIGFLILIVLTILSCQKEQHNDDQQILELVLQKQNQSNKLIYLNPIGENKTIKDFFRLRQTKERVFTFEHKHKDSILELDSLSSEIRTPIYQDRKITSNEYLMNGKGIDEKLETFLKDSFSYKKERIVKWSLPESLKDISLKEDNSKQENMITISVPVYNLDKNKAILKTFYRSSRNTAQQSILFIEKNNNSWNIIYSEEADMFLDLKIE